MFLLLLAPAVGFCCWPSTPGMLWFSVSICLSSFQGSTSPCDLNSDGSENCCWFPVCSGIFCYCFEDGSDGFQPLFMSSWKPEVILINILPSYGSSLLSHSPAMSLEQPKLKWYELNNLKTKRGWRDLLGIKGGKKKRWSKKKKRKRINILIILLHLLNFCFQDDKLIIWNLK